MEEDITTINHLGGKVTFSTSPDGVHEVIVEMLDATGYPTPFRVTNKDNDASWSHLLRQAVEVARIVHTSDARETARATLDEARRS